MDEEGSLQTGCEKMVVGNSGIAREMWTALGDGLGGVSDTTIGQNF